MLTAAELAALREAIPADPDRRRLLQTLEQRAAPVLAALPPIPRVKALLSRDGGTCPQDGVPLRFDPWSPGQHLCPRCGRSFSGDRHHRHWARTQHLWIAERAAELALLDGLTDNPRAGNRAAELLTAYRELYFTLPNRDNVLGPSRLFFSTYLESLWSTSYLAAAFLLRETGRLDPALEAGVNDVAEEAANLIGEFNEGLSNRQTWHSAALLAVAAWFDDPELARSAVDSHTGLMGHLADGFGGDGMWWEGENYHLFALRGLMLGMHWSRVLGFDLLEDPELAGPFRTALLAPAASALPDLTYPARRDSRFGVSLAHPASLELWEIGRAWLAGSEALDAWLAALYAQPTREPPAAVAPYDAWLHDAGRPVPPAYSRWDLSWWGLTAIQPAPDAAPDWEPASTLLASQGLAVLRHGQAYASLECGPEIGGHGHPDRLHLTLHAGGNHWLADAGTGSYQHETLAWYRSALAHNAVLLDGVNAGGADAWCEAFAAADGWAWCRGRAGELRRTLVLAPTHLLDVVELDAAQARVVELPWHLQGELQVESAGRWETSDWQHPFVTGAERDTANPSRRWTVTARGPGATELRATLVAPEAELLRAHAPGLPGEQEPQTFLLLRSAAAALRWITVLDFAERDAALAVRSVTASADAIELITGAGIIRYQPGPAGLSIRRDQTELSLAGLRRAPAPFRPLFEPAADPEGTGLAVRIVEPPALDGTLEGFDLAAPLELQSEHQYRRSEEPYDPEGFSALAWVNWDGEALYLAVAVSKPELVFRHPDAPPLLLDNEPDDIHSDGVQVYWSTEAHAHGFLIVPRGQNDLGIRAISETGAHDVRVSGRWSQTEDGYLVTLKLEDPAIRFLTPGAKLRFDLLVNEMQPGRLRRAGQLIWSGGGGWVYLRGDRHDLARAGSLELG